MPNSFSVETNDNVSAKLTTPSAKLRAKTDSQGTKDFTYTCDTIETTAKTTTCNKGADGEIIYGEYNVYSIDDGTNSLTFNAETQGNKYTIEQPFTVKAKADQEASQTIEGTTKTFTIKMDSANAAPKFYPGKEASTAALSSCSLSEDKTIVTCTPTSTEMKKDNNYSIYYKKPCETTFTETGITVTYKGSSSAFTNLSKIFLLIAGMMLF